MEFSSEIALPAASLFIYMCALFGVSLATRNNGYADVGYGGGFIVLALTSLLTGSPTTLSITLTLLSLVWGARLAWRIFRRNSGRPEDFRYAAWRAAWKHFYVRSFFQIYMLQGLVIFIVASPVVAANLLGAPSRLSLLAFLGVALWCIGFFFEAKGDAELDAFITDPASKGKLMTKGLWSLTRHPNYFGESLMWWGIWIASLSATLSMPLYAVLTFLSPLLITYLLRYVSGVPMLEAAMEKREGWAEYAAKVPVMVPRLSEAIRHFLSR